MVKLDRLINVLGSYGARVCCCPPSRETELRSVAVHDPADARPDAGDVFLAVGTASPAEAVRVAARARAIIALLRAPEPADEQALTHARESGIAVLLVDPAISWSQLFGVAYGLVLEGRETESGRGPTDLFAVADALAQAVGAPVTIEDHHSSVMAYSDSQGSADRARLETILSRGVPPAVRDALAAKGVFDHLESSDEPLFVQPMPEHGLTGRVVIAVHAGRELLGSVWVESDEPLEQTKRTVLADGARTAALHLLRARASADLERQVESDLVLRLLEGAADATAVLDQLGLGQRRFRVIALRALVGEERQAATLLAFERATVGFGWARPGRSTLSGNAVYTVLPCEDDPEPARGWIATLIAAMPGHASIAAGVGGPAQAAQLPASRQEADESLALQAKRERTASAVIYDESWHEILLQRVSDAAGAGRQPERGPVTALARHDEQHDTRYTATLRAWLDAQGDAHDAAARLGVHPNTIRYRMRKMAQVTTLELNQPDKRLAMTIALEVGGLGRS